MPILVFILVLLLGLVLSQTGLLRTRRHNSRLTRRMSAGTGATPPAASPIYASLNRLLAWQTQRLRQTQQDKPQKMDAELIQAGFHRLEWAAGFRIARVVGLVCGGLVGLIAGMLLKRPPAMCALGGVLLGYAFPAMVLGRLAKDRRRRILRELPDALSLLTVTLEAGVGIGEAMKIVGSDLDRQGGLLGRELLIVVSEMQAGVSSVNALRALGVRTGVAEVKSAAALVAQSQDLGASLAPALRATISLLNSRRRMAAEEAAQKAAIKMLFPLVLFILPAMLIVILGPAALSLKAMFR